MPLIETKGAASAQGFGEFATSSEKLYIESCFSTWLYTGNGSTQTITNGIDLAGKGGMVWVKCRSSAYDNILGDSERLGTSGGTRRLISNSTAAQSSTSITTFFLNSDGFATNGGDQDYNGSGETYASWTFRKQPKFFDVVTYTGNGSNRTISHNLGSVPGCIIVKRTDTTGAWQVYHRSIANTEYMVLNTTAAKATGTTRWNSTTPTSTAFSLGTDATVNASGGTYVAYLFAHDAGGFGLSGTDNVVSCGSYTTDGSGNATINLGYEPQWLLVKASSTTSDWYLLDTMRGMSNANPAENARLYANTSGAEASTGGTSGIVPTATGFNHLQYIAANATYIYIAIRRGPMKVPTSGTQVFAPVIRAGTGANAAITTGFVTDLSISQIRSGSALGAYNGFFDRLRGATKYLTSNLTNSETTYSDSLTSFASNTSISVGADAASGSINYGGTNYANWYFRRAPGFFDVVCYTGNGAVSGSTTRSINHNLQAVPELIICRARNDIDGWRVYSATLGINKILNLNQSSGEQADTTNWGTPTSSAFLIKYDRNWSGWNFVTYLFATVAGVSKVGSYTGNGSNQTINCGFTGGARFILIKRTDSTGDWYCWDSARGIVSGNDPHLSLNTTAAEVTTDDSVDTDSTGFIVNQLAATNINVSSASYIFLAVA